MQQGDAQKFREKLKMLLETAKKKKNVLEYSEIMDAFQDMNLSTDTIEKVYDYFENHNIDIIGFIDEAPEEEELDLTLPEGISIDDPVRMVSQRDWEGSAVVRGRGDQSGEADGGGRRHGKAAALPRPTCVWS